MSARQDDQTRWLLPSAVMLAAVLIGFGARSMWPRSASSAHSDAPVPVSTARVIRTDVEQRLNVAGMIGYQGSYSVVNELPAGITTWVPGPGQVILRGQAAYRLAGQPVTLFYGLVPAWRDIGPGMSPGTDVREMDQNLIALGFDPGRQIQPGDVFGWATEAAIERWQQAHGMLVTGTIPLGDVVFLPGPLRVESAVSAGTPVGPGTTAVSGTSTTLSVSVNLTPGATTVRSGEGVLITLPDGTTTVHGNVTAVGQVTTAQPQATQGSQGQASQGGQGNPVAAIPVTIRPDPGTGSRLPGSYDQAPVQVTITEAADRNVLAVPVTALLALPGGGYAVRTTAGTAHALIPVVIGLYDAVTGLVELSGPRLSAGLTVEVGQP
jgi:HlyD family secretion protein